MDRRALLAALGTAAAGCLGGPATTDRPPSPEPNAEFRVADLAVSTTKVAPTARYYVRITSHYSADAVEREPGTQRVVDVSEIDDPGVRAAVKEVLREGEVRRDEIPDGLRELTDRVDFFTWDARTEPAQRYTHWGVAVYRAYPDRAPVVEFDAELVDGAVSPDDPATLSFSLSNTGDRVQTVGSGPVPPFGVLWAEGPGGRVLLWRDYEAADCVTVTDDGVATCAVGKLTPIDPGGTVEKEYGLRRSTPVGALVVAGDYVVARTLGYSRQDRSEGPSTRVEWTVEFSVERV